METKCVMVIDHELPLGLIANTAAVLALTLGKKIENIIGPDNSDGEGRIHVGITTTPIPILKGTKDKIKEMREQLYKEDLAHLLVVDFSNAAQATKNYQEYTEKLGLCTPSDLEYLGIAIYGDKKKVNALTGSLPLMR